MTLHDIEIVRVEDYAPNEQLAEKGAKKFTLADGTTEVLTAEQIETQKSRGVLVGEIVEESTEAVETPTDTTEAVEEIKEEKKSKKSK